MPRASEWIHEQPESIMDIGCKVGAGLLDFRRLYPAAKLAGVDINRPALEVT